MIDQDTLATYERDGVAVLRRVLSPDWVARLAVAADLALADPHAEAEIYEGDRKQPLSYGELQVWKRLGAFRDSIFEGSLAKRSSIMMKSRRAQFFYDQLLVKEPGAQKRTPWHQDGPYWNVAGFQICSFWLALDRIPKHCGLEFVRGSHRWQDHNPQHFMDHSPYQDTGLADLPDIEGNRDRYDIVSFDLEPGDAIVFHASTVHGAPSMQGTGRRRAYSTRWVGDDAVFIKKPGERAFPVQDASLVEGKPLAGADYPVIWGQGK